MSTHTLGNPDTHIPWSSSCGDQSRWWGGSVKQWDTQTHTCHPPTQREPLSAQHLSYWCAEIWSSSGWSSYTGRMVSECVFTVDSLAILLFPCVQYMITNKSQVKLSLELCTFMCALLYPQCTWGHTAHHCLTETNYDLEKKALITDTKPGEMWFILHHLREATGWSFQRIIWSWPILVLQGLSSIKDKSCAKSWHCYFFNHSKIVAKCDICQPLQCGTFSN